MHVTMAALCSPQRLSWGWLCAHGSSCGVRMASTQVGPRWPMSCAPYGSCGVQIMTAVLDKSQRPDIPQDLGQAPMGNSMVAAPFVALIKSCWAQVGDGTGTETTAVVVDGRLPPVQPTRLSCYLNPLWPSMYTSWTEGCHTPPEVPRLAGLQAMPVHGMQEL